MNKHYQFLVGIEAYVAQNPDVGAYVADAVARGLDVRLMEARSRAADMEVALLAALGRRSAAMDGLIADKIKKWAGKTACLFDETIAELEAKANARK